MNNVARLLRTYTKGLCTTDTFVSLCLVRLAFPPTCEFLQTFPTPIHDHLYHFSPPLLIGMFPLHQCKNLLPPSASPGFKYSSHQDWEPLFPWKKTRSTESSVYVQNLLLWVWDSTQFQSHLVCPLIFNSLLLHFLPTFASCSWLSVMMLT